MALRSLTQIFENTKYVVRPVFHYPEIVSILTSLVQNEPHSKTRGLVFKLLGTIGAIDPYIMKMVLTVHEGGTSSQDADFLDQN